MRSPRLLPGSPRELSLPERVTVDRRSFLRLLGIGGAGVAVATTLPARAGVAQFPEGIASGDPIPNGGLIWTRVVAALPDQPVPVLWEVSETDDFTRIAAGGVVDALPADDFTIHVRVRGLLPDRWYFYRFTVDGETSVTGRLRTAPRRGTMPDRLRFAFASCQQRSSLYVALRAITEENVDFLMHLGDYIYVNDGGTITLDDYRRVYRRFRSNALLRDCHAKVPLVAMWDDGEFYNGVDRTGDPARLQNGRQAWFEYMPFQRFRRESERSHRRFSWGRLADVFMIDVRQYRDPAIEDTQALNGTHPMFDPARTTLGARQRQWLLHGLSASRTAWRLIGNPYNALPWRLTDTDTPAYRASTPNFQPNVGGYAPNEAWDDYWAERRTILRHLEARRIRNTAFVSAHTHIYLAGSMQPDYDDPQSPTVAYDFVSGSLTADPDPMSFFGPGTTREQAIAALTSVATYLKGVNPFFSFLDFFYQGYAVVDLTPEELIVEFRVLDTFDPNATPHTSARFRVVSGSDTLETLYSEFP